MSKYFYLESFETFSDSTHILLLQQFQCIVLKQSIVQNNTRLCLTLEGFEYLIPVSVYLVSPSTADGTK